MHIIAKPALVGFWPSAPDAETPLRNWYSICDKTVFQNFSHLRLTFPTADKIGKFTVFNIAGNKYRLVTIIHFDRKKIFIRNVLTHKEYDRGKWKKE